MIEVEVKAPLEGLAEIEELIIDNGGRFKHEEAHTDTYYNAPDRDFKKTDEALRIRENNGRTYLTYKGPKQSIKTKTRKELEIPVNEGIDEILIELGYRQAGIVEKTRRIYVLDELTVCLDDVKNLGTYIEIESNSPDDEGKIFSLLDTLGIEKSTCTLKSYLGLLTEKGVLKTGD